MSHSKISGWGLFCMNATPKGSLIMEYVGEILDDNEALERETWNDIENVTYMFNVNEEVITLNIFLVCC